MKSQSKYFVFVVWDFRNDQSCRTTKHSLSKSCTLELNFKTLVLAQIREGIFDTLVISEAL